MGYVNQLLGFVTRTSGSPNDKTHFRPHNPDTRVTLKVTVKQNIEYALTTPTVELAVSGSGSHTLKLPNDQTFRQF